MVLDDRDTWAQAFEQGWLAHYEQTGTLDWPLYPRPRNRPLAASDGVELARSRLLLISTAGAYDPATQQPFDAASPLGDYTTRELPLDVDLRSLQCAHDHYDHGARRLDPGVLFPHALLQERVKSGVIGSVAPTWVSFMGYQPDLRQVVDSLCPQVVEVALREHAQAALLVPS